jgi:hypothetical protein
MHINIILEFQDFLFNKTGTHAFFMGKPINISIVCQLVYFNRLELQIKYRYQTNLKPSIVTYSEI